VGRVALFINGVSTKGIGAITSVVGGPKPGSMAWKLAHGQDVNLLLMGDGGAENDSPLLTDTIIAISLDGATHHAAMISIPRDIWVNYDAWPSAGPRPAYSGKINEGFEIGSQDAGGTKLPAYTGPDGGGHLAEHTVSAVTGLAFDGYITVDFKAFRDVVDAIGGVNVCLDGPLDDEQYPNYADGYVPGGIHFKAGCQNVNGEQSLELARSRHADQPDQASDFGRAKRQQLILSAVKKKITSPQTVISLFSMLGSLQDDVKTDLDLASVLAIRDWGQSLPDSNILRVGLTNGDLLADQGQGATCGPVYSLCPQDSTFAMVRWYLQMVPAAPAAAPEKASIQVGVGTYNISDLPDRLTTALSTLGFQVQSQGHQPVQATTTIADYSGGHYPKTSAWLSKFFGVPVTPAASPTPAGQVENGLVVTVGRDFALRWYGLA
jgi:LCP family protein required for cell wall assembly